MKTKIFPGERKEKKAKCEGWGTETQKIVVNKRSGQA